MPPSPPDRRTRKRLATRQKISDTATRLFIKRGFDAVTVDEIAAAADVARMTVFNHFARKEDMFFDLDEEAREDILVALADRAPGTSPTEALRLFAHTAVAEQRPYVRFFETGSEHFMKTVQGSEALKSRARAIRDELTSLLTHALAQAAGRKTPDATASLAASLVVATWQVALMEAHRVFQKAHNIDKANKTFLNLIDQGARGLHAVVKGTPYA